MHSHRALHSQQSLPFHSLVIQHEHVQQMHCCLCSCLSIPQCISLNHICQFFSVQTCNHSIFVFVIIKHKAICDFDTPPRKRYHSKIKDKTGNVYLMVYDTDVFKNPDQIFGKPWISKLTSLRKVYLLLSLLSKDIVRLQRQ